MQHEKTLSFIEKININLKTHVKHDIIHHGNNNLGTAMGEYDMFNNLLTAITKKKKSFKNASSKFSINIAISFFISLTIVIILFSTFIMLIFSYQSESMISTANSQSLEQLNLFNDKFIFERINNICDQYFTENSDSEQINGFFQDFQNTSKEDMQLVLRTLKSIMIQNDFFDNIILYNSKYDSMISTNDGVIFGASDPRIDISLDNRMFSYLEEIGYDFWIPLSDNTAFDNKNDVLTYIHYISVSDASGFGNKNVNCAIISIDKDSISNYITSVNIPGMQGFLIMDENQKVLTYNEGFADFESSILQSSNLLNKISEYPKGYERAKVKGTTSNVMWEQSSISGWKYVYAMSLSQIYKQTLSIIITITLIALIILLLSLFFVKKFTNRIYEPFAAVIENARSSLDSSEYSDNEFEMLNNLISDFSNVKAEIVEISDKYNDIIVDSVASDIIHGFTINSQSEILKQLSDSGVELKHKYLSLLTLELNPLVISAFQIGQREMLIYNILETLTNNLSCIPYRTSSTVIEVIANYDNSDLFVLAQQIKQLFSQKTFINIYFCENATTIDKLNEQHKKTKNVLKYSYIYGYDNLLNVNELLEIDSKADLVDVAVLNKIENTLLDGNRDLFFDECNRLLNSVKTEKHSFNYAQNTILQIFSIICRVARGKNIPIKEHIEFDNIIKNVSFDSSTIYLFQISDVFFNKLENSPDTHQEKLIKCITSYIDDNVTGDLSLVGVAQHFNLSAGYLSKFFKENTDTSFAKYIIEKKFSYAAQEFVHSPQKSVAEIAEELGYFDSAYFSRQFKSRYGMTPMQYRKNNIKF